MTSDRSYKCENCDGVGLVRHVELRHCPVCRCQGTITRSKALSELANYVVERFRVGAIPAAWPYAAQAEALGDVRALAFVGHVQRLATQHDGPMIDDVLARRSTMLQRELGRDIANKMRLAISGVSALYESVSVAWQYRGNRWQLLLRYSKCRQEQRLLEGFVCLDASWAQSPTFNDEWQQWLAA